MNCPQHGISKAKHWPANNRGPENVACTRKTGNDWCNVRVTMPQLRAMQAAAMVSPATVEPPEASEETYDLPYDD
jgi:hypothetical protein